MQQDNSPSYIEKQELDKFHLYFINIVYGFMLSTPLSGIIISIMTIIYLILPFSVSSDSSLNLQNSFIGLFASIALFSFFYYLLIQRRKSTSAFYDGKIIRNTTIIGLIGYGIVLLFLMIT